MTVTSNDRKMAENEVVFRKYNESVQQGLADLTALAKETGQLSHINEEDTPLHFYCECSDENCLRRLQVKPSVYTAIHERRDHFVIVDGHETPEIEHVIDRQPTYSVVEKYIKPPESADALHHTPAHND